ncbi:MAG: hypothetical protein COS94_10145 [Candidatus Hydrogenedentes bacterium CG07_land_8_20_14_0_80_42_17]|nr:MAG: hypothetical protein AUJ18_01020 [Candidatus Hydrogenedentes bacterium CG1_02_42_14]PIU46428.1 MAG: hypothetical protein COS94_10145 [Candidatus Hydrogenedentes bacterium CG07_land_8_20_14_0_80_42_17]
MIRRLLFFAIVLFTFLFSFSKVDARIGLGTMFADDATVLWAGTWESKIGLDAGAGLMLEGSELSAVRAPISLRYGWKDRLEVGFGIPFAFQSSSNSDFDGSGLSDLSVALKYQMTQNEGNYPATSTEIKLGYGLNNPASSDAISIGIVYALTKVFSEGRSAGHLNLGYTLFMSKRDDVFQWGGAYERRFRDTMRWSLGVNSGQQLVPGVRKDIVGELGLTKELTPTLEMAFSGGAGFTKESPNWIARVGITKEFGKTAGDATNYRKAEWGRPPAPGAEESIAQAESAMAQNDYPLAISLYREAISKDSSIPSAWNNMGNAYYRMGRPREAIEAYEKAAELEPKNADIPFNIGLAYYRIGEVQSARRAFARALEIDPNHSLARSNLISLGGLTGETK